MYVIVDILELIVIYLEYLLYREYVYGFLCMYCDMFVFLV